MIHRYNASAEIFCLTAKWFSLKFWHSVSGRCYASSYEIVSQKIPKIVRTCPPFNDLANQAICTIVNHFNNNLLKFLADTGDLELWVRFRLRGPNVEPLGYFSFCLLVNFILVCSRYLFLDNFVLWYLFVSFVFFVIINSSTTITFEKKLILTIKINNNIYKLQNN